MIEPIFLTLKLAGLTTLILMVMGTPLAWWLARSNAWWKEAIGAVVALPLVLPPTVLGFYLLIALGPNSPLGQLAISVFGHSLPFSFTGLVIGSVIYSMPFVVQPVRNAFEAVGNKPLEAAATLRASPLDAFFNVALPLARPGLLSGAVLGFAHTVGEFGVVLMIGGNIPGKTKVLSIAIYDHVESLEWTQAHILSAGMLVFSFCVILIMMVSEKHMRKGRQMGDISVRFAAMLDDFDLDVAFDIPAHGVTALFGQSGCGKTTVLRCLAGLQYIENGYLRIGNQIWQDEKTFLPAHKRAVGYVFQEANLFDHLSVQGNLQFGLKRTKNHKGEKFDDVVHLLGLRDLLERHPHNLSGGERQRVAIARALLSAPDILLMDEPLSALDRFSKDEIIPYLEKLSDVLSIPIVFISHDTDEVERLADHMVLMERGRIRANAPLLDVLCDPTLFIAKSAKTASILQGCITSFDTQDHLSTLDIGGADLYVPGVVGQVGDLCRLRIAATDVSLAVEKPSKTTILNVLEARIEDIHMIDGAQVNIVLSIGTHKRGVLIARITKRSLKSFGFQVGQPVYAQVKGVSMVERRKGD